MKRLFLFFLFFTALFLVINKLKNTNEQINKIKEKKQEVSKSQTNKLTKKSIVRDERVVQQSANSMIDSKNIELDETSQASSVSYDPNDLVSCETQISNCLPKPETDPEDPSANTFCITYASNCNSESSIQRTWKEEEVFVVDDNLNSESNIKTNESANDEYNRQGLENNQAMENSRKAYEAQMRSKYPRSQNNTEDTQEQKQEDLEQDMDNYNNIEEY